VGVKCLAQEHNTISPARAQTRTARSGDERTNHEATAPPTYTSITANEPMKTQIVLCNDPVLNKTDCMYGFTNLNKTNPYITLMYGQQG